MQSRHIFYHENTVLAMRKIVQDSIAIVPHVCVISSLSDLEKSVQHLAHDLVRVGHIYLLFLFAHAKHKMKLNRRVK